MNTCHQGISGNSLFTAFVRRPPTIVLALLGVCLLGPGCDKKPDPKVPTKTDVGNEVEPSKSEQEGRRFIDVHTHLNPPAYSVTASIYDRIGGVRVVNMSGGYLAHVDDTLEATASTENTVATFFNIDWSTIDEPDFGTRRASELEQAIQRGYAGLKISKHLGLGVRLESGELLKVDDPRLDPIWRKAGELGIPVAIHTADPRAFFEPPGPDNERNAELSHAPSWSFHGDEFPSRRTLLEARDRLIARHPETHFILLHIANNPEDIDYVDKLLRTHANTSIDVAARIGELGRHPSKRVRAFLRRHSNRVLFGTDLQLSIRPHRGEMTYRLTLGSISKEPPKLRDIQPFFEQHWSYFETRGDPIDHPIPIQGDWKVEPVGLSLEELNPIYFGNAERRIFAPHLGRRAAFGVANSARSLRR